MFLIFYYLLRKNFYLFLKNKVINFYFLSAQTLDSATHARAPTTCARAATVEARSRA